MKNGLTKVSDKQAPRVRYLPSHRRSIPAPIRWMLIIGFILLGILLSGCKSAQQSETSPTPKPTRTPVSLGPTSTPKATSTSPSASPPTPTLAPLPALSDQDWFRGPDDAEVTIVLYSDFQ
jgi:hypothetical protein